MKKETEVDLCRRFVKAHPRPEHLYFEVYVPSGRCDVVHSEGGIVTIYEAKLALNATLLEQCVARKVSAHYVYAVVPKLLRRQDFIRGLFVHFGIGIIVPENGRLREVSPPRIFRKPQKITLYEENRKEIPGSQAGGITPFGLMVRDMKGELHRRGRKALVSEIFETQYFYKTPKQFRSNIYQWIRRGVIKGVDIGGGELWLIDAEGST